MTAVTRNARVAAGAGKRSRLSRASVVDSFNATAQIPRFRAVQLVPKRRDYAVIIPVLNEGIRLHKQLTKMHELRCPVDIILADGPSSDGSTDPDVIETLGVGAIVALDEQGGYSSSIRAALACALHWRYRGVIFVDGNNKDGVEAIERFVDSLKSGYACVQGSRYLPGGEAEHTPLLRHVLIKYFYSPALSLLSGFRFTDCTNGFCAFSSEFLLDQRVNVMRDVFKKYELLFYLKWAACQLKLKVGEIPVSRKYPAGRFVPTKLTNPKAYWEVLKPLVMIALRRF